MTSLAADLVPVVFLDGRGRAVVLAPTREAALLAESEARLGGFHYTVETLVVERDPPRGISNPTGTGVRAQIHGVRCGEGKVDPRPGGDLVLALRSFAHYPVRADGAWFYLLGVSSTQSVLELSLIWMLGAN